VDFSKKTWLRTSLFNDGLSNELNFGRIVSLDSSFNTVLGYREVSRLPWRRASDPAINMTIFLRYAPQTDRVLHVRHDMISDHVGVTIVERPDPKGIPTFSQRRRVGPHGGVKVSIM
jgi:hypothetical protein